MIIWVGRDGVNWPGVPETQQGGTGYGLAVAGWRGYQGKLKKMGGYGLGSHLGSDEGGKCTGVVEKLIGGVGE